MGNTCTRGDSASRFKEHGPPDLLETHEADGINIRPSVKGIHDYETSFIKNPGSEINMTSLNGSNVDETAATRILTAHDANIKARDPSLSHSQWQQISDFNPSSSVEAYLSMRETLLEQERALDFDYACQIASTPQEDRVNSIIKYLRCQDNAEIYQKAQSRRGYGGQFHRRFAGDHFLSNVDLIARTSLFDIAHRIPKGAHLHIHFNSCLQPRVLLDIAKNMDRMFITSDVPLVENNDFENFQMCEIQFSIMTPEKERPGNLFMPDYNPRDTMRFKDFLQLFAKHYPKASAEAWLTEKLEFQEDEAHQLAQTAEG